MKFDDFFPNNKYDNGIAGQFNTDKNMFGTFLSALSQISTVPKYQEMLGLSLTDTGAMSVVNKYGIQSAD